MLREYRKKRDFKRTNEPRGSTHQGRKKPIFVIQRHSARRLHWDFRLEHEGVLKSWAVTNEPSLNPAIRRLAIEVEDHPRDYARFHGTIPKGQYGAGEVLIWDRGTYSYNGSLSDQIERGVVHVVLKGRRLKGSFALVRIAGNGLRARWLFFKTKPKPTALRVPDIEAA